MLLAYSRRSHRGEHALLSYPKAANRLNCCRRLIKKERGRFLYLIGGGGRGAEKKLSVQFYSHSPSPTFYFAPPPLVRLTFLFVLN